MPEELFDLSTDPGERKNLVHALPEKAAEMRALLQSLVHETPTTPTTSAPAGKDEAIAVTLRFVGAGGAHRVSGSVSVDPGVSLVVRAVNLGPEALHGKSPRGGSPSRPAPTRRWGSTST